jgi:hypothetical protein
MVFLLPGGNGMRLNTFLKFKTTFARKCGAVFERVFAPRFAMRYDLPVISNEFIEFREEFLWRFPLPISRPD